MEGIIKVSIIDDQKVFRQLLASSIELKQDLTVIGSYRNGKDFLDDLEASPDNHPDVAIIDIDMPVMNGLELNNSLQNLFPDIKKIILSLHEEERLISKAISDGAASYIEKDSSQEELFTAIFTVYRSGFYMNPRIMAAMRNNFRHEGETLGFSMREIQVLKLICKEYNSAEIAEQLFLSPRTVEGYRKTLIEKVGCRNTAGLVLFAIKNNFIT